MPAPEFRAPGLDAPAKPRKRELREVADVLSEIAAKAARIPDPYLRELVPVLAQAQKELRADLAAWIANAKDGNERFTAQQYRSAILQLQGAFEVIESRVSPEMRAILQEAGADAGGQALEHLHTSTARMAAVFGHSVRPIQLDQAAILAQVQHQLIPQYRNSANRYAEGISDDIRRQLAVGVARGETFSQMTNRLVRLGGPRGWVALRGTLGEPGSYAEYISEGLFRKYRGWAERVVVTETLNAYNVHHLEGLHQANEEDPGWLARWDASVDARGCARCAALDGKIVNPGDPFESGDDGHPVPPKSPAPAKAKAAKQQENAAKAEAERERKANLEAEERARQKRERAEQLALEQKQEAERAQAAKAKADAEARAAAEAKQKAEAEARAREKAAAAKARQEAQARAAAEAEAKARADAERARVEAEKKAAAERAATESRRLAEAEAVRKAAEAKRAAQKAATAAAKVAEEARARTAEAAKAESYRKARAAKAAPPAVPNPAPSRAEQATAKGNFKDRSTKWQAEQLGVPSMSAKETTAVMEYAGPLHTAINEKLRGKGKQSWNDHGAVEADIPPEVKAKLPPGFQTSVASSMPLAQMRDAIDGAMAKSTIPDDLLTYRGMRDYGGALSTLKPGDLITDPAYKSTTMAGYDQAAQFSAILGGGHGATTREQRIVMTIEVPKGSKGLNVSGVAIAARKGKPGGGAAESAQELLLPRTTNFRVISVEMRGDIKAIRVRAE